MPVSGSIFEKDEPSNQAAYQPTPYHDSSWEVLGQPPQALQFHPMSVPVVNEKASFTDPMFADFGGVERGSAASRWHLPKGVAYEPQNEGSGEEDDGPQGVLVTEEELEQFKSAAFQQGYEEAQKAAKDTIAQEKSRMEKTIVEAFKDLQKQASENLNLIEKRAAALALQVAKKIIDQAVEINPEYVVKIIQEAIGLAGTAVVKNIRVSPQDYEFIQVVGLAREMKKTDSIWEFIADPAIKAGCVVETSSGEIDYQLDLAWERIKNKVARLVK